MHFSMTTDRWVRGITWMTLLTLGVTSALVLFGLGKLPNPPAPVLVLPRLVMGLVWLVLLVTAMGTPTGVKVTALGLAVQRRVLPDFEVPWQAVLALREGPALSLWGRVRRVARTGGFFGFTGLFSVPEVGLVRCWIPALNRPTVLVERRSGRPLLLGVDDVAGLLESAERARRRAFHVAR